MKNNQKGFGAIEGLLIAILLCLVGFIGYYVWNTNQKTDTTNSTSIESSKTASNNKSDLKEYCSVNEKACFKYPSSWKVDQSCSDVDCTGMDVISLTSPSGSTISYTSSVSGIGGDCNQGVDPNFVYTKVEKLTTASSLYLVEATRADEATTTLGLSGNVNGAAPKTGDTGSCMNFFAFTAKNTDNADASLRAYVDNKEKAADLVDAEAALLSFKYQ